MPSKLIRHVRSNVLGYVAVFIALGGTAYAANTIGSADVINDSLLSEDLKNNAAVTTFDVVNDTAAGGGLGNLDLAASSVRSSEVQDNSLTGADINEATLQGSGPVQASDRVAVNDPTGGAATDTAVLIDTGTFTIKGRCDDQGAAGVAAQVLVNSASGTYAASSNELNLGSTSGENNLLNEGAQSTPDRQVASPFSVIHSGGEALQGTAHVVTKSQGVDCVFAVSGLGA